MDFKNIPIRPATPNFLKILIVFLLFTPFSLSANSQDFGKQELVLSFWFGKLNREGQWSSFVESQWFQHNPAFDEQITFLFADDVEKAAKGCYNDWESSPRGRLALIILLDQFPRNIYRGTKRAFAFDSKAVCLTEKGIALKQDQQLLPIERAFFYMPLMHSEKRESQKRSLELYTSLAEIPPDSQRPYFRRALEYAYLHQEIIDRFGRFPHRNPILGRSSTKAEETYLAQTENHFGQKKRS